MAEDKLKRINEILEQGIEATGIDIDPTYTDKYGFAPEHSSLIRELEELELLDELQELVGGEEKLGELISDIAKKQEEVSPRYQTQQFQNFNEEGEPIGRRAYGITTEELRQTEIQNVIKNYIDTPTNVVDDVSEEIIFTLKGSAYEYYPSASSEEVAIDRVAEYREVDPDTIQKEFDNIKTTTKKVGKGFQVNFHITSKNELELVREFVGSTLEYAETQNMFGEDNANKSMEKYLKDKVDELEGIKEIYKLGPRNVVDSQIIQNLETDLKNKYPELETFILEFNEKKGENLPYIQEDFVAGRDYIYLNSIDVFEDARGQGVGDKVMKELIAFADTNDIPILLDTRGGDTGLTKFYEKYGFLNTGNIYTAQQATIDGSFRLVTAELIRQPGSLAGKATTIGKRGTHKSYQEAYGKTRYTYQTLPFYTQEQIYDLLINDAPSIAGLKERDIVKWAQTTQPDKKLADEIYELIKERKFQQKNLVPKSPIVFAPEITDEAADEIEDLLLDLRGKYADVLDIGQDGDPALYFDTQWKFSEEMQGRGINFELIEVSPEHQNKGIGTEILNEVKKIATKHKIPIAASAVDRSPTGFFAKQGFLSGDLMVWIPDSIDPKYIVEKSGGSLGAAKLNDPLVFDSWVDNYAKTTTSFVDNLPLSTTVKNQFNNLVQGRARNLATPGGVADAVDVWELGVLGLMIAAVAYKEYDEIPTILTNKAIDMFNSMTSFYGIPPVSKEEYDLDYEFINKVVETGEKYMPTDYIIKKVEDVVKGAAETGAVTGFGYVPPNLTKTDTMETTQKIQPGVQEEKMFEQAKPKKRKPTGSAGAKIL